MRRRALLEVDLRCYPKDDRAFLEAAQRAIAESRETIFKAERLLAAVREKLVRSYPNVRIQPREPIASDGDDGATVWYCYRDGHLFA